MNSRTFAIYNKTTGTRWTNYSYPTLELAKKQLNYYNDPKLDVIELTEETFGSRVGDIIKTDG
jgi:hypothetical protein